MKHDRENSSSLVLLFLNDQITVYHNNTNTKEEKLNSNHFPIKYQIKHFQCQNNNLFRGASASVFVHNFHTNTSPEFFVKFTTRNEFSDFNNSQTLLFSPLIFLQEDIYNEFIFDVYDLSKRFTRPSSLGGFESKIPMSLSSSLRSSVITSYTPNMMIYTTNMMISQKQAVASNSIALVSGASEPNQTAIVKLQVFTNINGMLEEVDGSGVIIGPHSILTASHFFQDTDTGRITQSGIVITLGNGQQITGSNQGHFNLLNNSGHKFYPDTGAIDYAILDTTANLASYTGFTLMAGFPSGQAIYPYGTVILGGYPLGGNQQNFAINVVLDNTFPLLDYADSGTASRVQQGMSGGPAYVYNGTQFFVVGDVSTDAYATEITSSDLMTIQSWENAPIISGVKIQQGDIDTRSIYPLSSVVVTDENTPAATSSGTDRNAALADSETETVSVSVSSPSQGTLTDSFGGTIEEGVYSFEGSADDVTSALDNLQFTPTPFLATANQTITTDFLINDTDDSGYTSSSMASVSTEETAPSIGSQSVVVSDPVINSMTGITTIYSITVDVSPLDLLFTSERSNSLKSQTISSGITYTGGSPNPTGDIDSISVLAISSGSVLYDYETSNTSGLGPNNTYSTITTTSYNDTAGDYATTVPIDVEYGNGTSAISLSVDQKIYAPAEAEFSISGQSSFPDDLGVVHVGQEKDINIEITNVASGNLTDELILWPGTFDQFVAENGVTLDSGDTGTVLVSLFAQFSGEEIADQTLFDPTSRDPDLPDVVASGGIELEAEVYNYADPVLLNAEPGTFDSSNGTQTYTSLDGPMGGTLTETGDESYTLDFGTITESDAFSDFANILVENDLPSAEFSDLLSGSIAVSGGGFIDNVETGVAENTSGGNFLELGDFFPSSPGQNTLTVSFEPTSVDSAGTTALPEMTLTVTDDVIACFLTGTRFLTKDGECSVEQLSIGDELLIDDGEPMPIKWIGSRRIDCRRHPRPQDIWPVRIHPQTFGDGLPMRDLWLSPEHGIFVDGVLIPIKCLINGTTIVQERRNEITYWHVELERHEIIFAERLPCESYLDTGNRSVFIEGSVVRLHADFAPEENCEAIWEAAGCAPMRVGGEPIARVAARLRGRAKKLGHVSPRSKSRRAAPGVTKCTAELAGLLQPDWYLAAHADVAAAGMDAATHYAGWGRREGRLPCAEVDVVRALGLIDSLTLAITMPDLVVAGIDPFEHFCAIGWRERRRPNPYFHTGWYLDTHDVPDGTNPLLHYVLLGESQGLQPSPHFDPVWYRQRYELKPSLSALAHYLKHRRTGRFSPRPSFDVEAYSQQHAATLLPGRDPYAHFLAIGRFAAPETHQADRMVA